MGLSIQAQPLQSIQSIAGTKFYIVDLPDHGRAERSERMAGIPIYDKAFDLIEALITKLVEPDRPDRIRNDLSSVNITAMYEVLIKNKLKECQEQLLKEQMDLASIPLNVGGIYPYTGAKAKCQAYVLHLRSLFHRLKEFAKQMDYVILQEKKIGSVRDEFRNPPRNADINENLGKQYGNEHEKYLFYLYDRLERLDFALHRLWELLFDLLMDWVDDFGLDYLPDYVEPI